MNCLECRRLTLINPQDDNPARKRHLEECDGCGRFARQILKQDDLIREATQIEAPEGFAARILLNQSLQPTSRRPTRWHWLSLAASFLLALAFVPALIDDAPLIEQDLVAHMNKHDMFQGADHVHVSEPEQIEKVLAFSDTALPGDLGGILEATTCVIDGQVMAHLLMQKDNEEFVVFIIPQQSIAARTYSDEKWAGQLVNIDHRSLAVFNHDGSNLRTASSHFAEVFSTPLSSG